MREPEKRSTSGDRAYPFSLGLAGDREVWPKMENRSRLPGEPSLDPVFLPVEGGSPGGYETPLRDFRETFWGFASPPQKVLG